MKEILCCTGCVEAAAAGVTPACRCASSRCCFVAFCFHNFEYESTVRRAPSAAVVVYTAIAIKVFRELMDNAYCVDGKFLSSDLFFVFHVAPNLVFARPIDYRSLLSVLPIPVRPRSVTDKSPSLPRVSFVYRGPSRVHSLRASDLVLAYNFGHASPL